MLSERGRRALLGIKENIEADREFTAGLDFEAFATDRRTLYAVTRCLEIISEASRRLDDATRARHPQLPWRQIAGAGDVYRHAYERVAPRLVWNTVMERLDALMGVCEAELSRSEGEDAP